MPTILRNDVAEALLLQSRAGRNAGRQVIGTERGAFLVVPTSVVVAGQVGAQLVYPLAVEVEPGTLVTAPGRAEVSGVVAGTAVSGTFSWTLLGEVPDAARYRFRRGGSDVKAPAWAAQLPRSQRLAAEEPRRQLRDQSRLQRQRRDAEHILLARSDGVIRSACRGAIERALRFRPALDIDDLVQRSLQTAARLLPLYASAKRPPCSWLGMLRLDARRDLHRELSRFDWFPGEATSAVALARACGVSRRNEAADTLAALIDAAGRRGLSVPRIDAKHLDAALRATCALEHETAASSAVVPGPEPAEPHTAALLTTVALLVTDDAETVARAALGDPVAVDDIGEKVLRCLNGNRPCGPVAARRCWEQFHRSGQLFSSPAGLTQFQIRLGSDRLGQLDECLRRAAGLPASAPLRAPAPPAAGLRTRAPALTPA